ncbi:MAG: family 78 glycoside hydrolase catalytic domain [Planctomycetota bacterium]
MTKPVRSARVYASALGVYELCLNGKRVGDYVFAPGWTDYRKRVHYQTYDVKDLVRRGENAIGAIIGDGWYAGHVGLGGPNRYGNFPVLICQLEVEYDDGTREMIVTDATWKASPGPLVTGDMLMGETRDARKEMSGWAEPGFDDAAWQAATAREVSVPLEAERGPAVRKLIELDAKRIAEPTPGAYVFDMGQNMVGWARIAVRAPAGTTVQLRFAEMLNPDGTMYTRNLRGAKNIDRYVCRGDGLEVWEPRFTFHGFRYVEMTGLPRRPSLDAVKGVVVYSDTPATGTFECSQKMLNQLQQNIIWGQRGNYLSIPTDCPQRDERLGWTGDAQVFVRTAAFNMDVASFFKKWLVDLDDAQGAGGDFPDVAPRVAAGSGTAAWGDAGTICPWSVYVAYGDERFLADHLPAMEKWVEYCRRTSRDLIRPNKGYGDWLAIGAKTPKEVISTAYFAHSTDLTARAARILGETAKAEKYERLFEDIKRAFNDKFVQPDGRIHGNTQSCYLMALSFDLLPEALRPKAAEHLVERIESKRWHLSTGFVGVSMLLPVLTRYGRTDVAWRLLETDTFPSWLFSVKHGATTIWERWDGWTPDKGFQNPGMNSFNHYSLGSCGEWMYGVAAGIAPDPAKPGYKHIIIRPRPGGTVTWVKGSLESMHGKIATHWRLARGRFELDVTIPANTTATVYVPARSEGDVREGGAAASRAEGVKFVRMDDGAAVFEIGSGDYAFSAPSAPR